MSDFNSLQETHLSLLKKQESWDVAKSSQAEKEEISQEVKDFIDTLVVSGSEIVDLTERDQLRAILRYWASFYSSLTGEYPNTRLAPPRIEDGGVFIPPYSFQTETVARAPQSLSVLPIWLWILGGVTIVILVGLGIFLYANGPASPTPTPTLSGIALRTSTEISLVTKTPTSSPTTVVALPTNTSVALGDPRTATAAALLTEAAAAGTQMPTPTAELGASGIIQISNVSNSDRVPHRMILEGTYSNLAPGYSIHIMLQPINKCGVDNILVQDNFIVEETAGNWQIPVMFGEGDELSEPEQYNIRIAIASNEKQRELVANNPDLYQECFDQQELPLFVYPPLVVNVERGAYTAIQDFRLLFASSIGTNIPYDIATTKLDGSDFRLLTNTPDTNEYWPDLCELNQKIVFYEFNNATGFRAISLIDSNGENQTPLVSEKNVVYEHPTWSPDCRYIAYGARQSNLSDWEIFIIDFDNPSLGAIRLTPGRYPTWMPEGQTLIYQRLDLESDLPTFIVMNVGTCELDFVLKTSKCGRLSFPLVHIKPPQGVQPSISPDGNYLSYASYPIKTDDGGYYQIIMSFDLVTSSVPEEVTQPAGATQDWLPEWGPDREDQIIFFESSRSLLSGKTNIWVVNRDGSGLHQVTDEDRINIQPAIDYMDTYLPVPLGQEVD